MKIKKTFKAIAAAAAAVSVLSSMATGVSAISSGNAIDFEDGDCSFVYMNTSDGDSASANLSVEDYDGSKQLKVDVQDKDKVPKIWFDLDKITSRDNTIKINTLEMDITIVPKNSDEAVGWAGGAIGAAGGFDANSTEDHGQANPGWSSGDWSCDDGNAYEAGMAAKTHVKRKFLLANQKYTAEGVNPFFGVMRWGTETDYVMYIDNIVLYDSDGNAIAVGNGTSGAAAAPAASDTAAAPASDAPTTSATTGNASAGVLFAAMALSAAAAFAVKKSSK